MPARDVFICHASPDKVDYARPLAASLSRHGVSSWLDEAVLQAGDSITDAISDGLRLERVFEIAVPLDQLPPELLVGLEAEPIVLPWIALEQLGVSTTADLAALDFDEATFRTAYRPK